MKQLIAMIGVMVVGNAIGQTTNRDVEIFERYENGELVEQRRSATENGVPIENFDFDQAKREIELKSAGMEQKMEEMKRKMDVKSKEMDQRMQEMQQRSHQMQLEMEQRMNEMEKKDVPQKMTPLPNERAPMDQKPGVGTSSKDVKFT